MSFLSRKKRARVDAPWWNSQDFARTNRSITPGSLVVLAIIAGLVGGALGINASGGFLGGKANLVTASNTIERKPDSVAGLANRVLPSVVSITTGSGSTGSGFIIDSSGFILTNNHVVEQAALSKGRILVTLNNGKEFESKIVGRDASYDLAILKILATGLPALQFGNSDEVAVGDSVIAIGSPLGLSGTVTLGIISAKDRAVTAGGSAGETSFINALQTDAAINPGNSGGPLINTAGAVIGVNSAIATLSGASSAQAGSIGLGFAIPINQARKTADQLIKTGKATYPVIGVLIDMNFAGPGAKVTASNDAVVAGGPAEKAGIKSGDVIIEFGGKSINTPDELIVAIRAKSVGDRVETKFKRGSSTRTTTIVLAAGKN
jgi:putative serine protease PepD|uniref:S1C family serine protease n=1 Tax=Candidatus Planktophila sp. TaxID=2175601 RepID=UPI004049F460